MLHLTLFVNIPFSYKYVFLGILFSVINLEPKIYLCHFSFFLLFLKLFPKFEMIWKSWLLKFITKNLKEILKLKCSKSFSFEELWVFLASTVLHNPRNGKYVNDVENHSKREFELFLRRMTSDHCFVYLTIRCCCNNYERYD